MTAAYGPTLLAYIGFGAVIPMEALQARALGASVGLAAFITALDGIAQVVGDLPAGHVAERLGEKWAIILACLVDAALMALVYYGRSLPILALAVFIHGLTGSIFGLARQSYLTEMIPLRYRARAMSSMGGVFRIGTFVGPLAGAAIIARWNLSTAFAFSAIMSLLAAAITFVMPELPSDVAQRRRRSVAEPGPRMRDILHAHRTDLLTVGIGCLALMLVRAGRQTLIPLWAESHGISPATTSLIYSLSMLCDVVLFYPGGAVMDRFGRWWVTVPATIVMSLGFLVLPLAHTTAAITAVACLLGLGNGVTAGVVMTLGADYSPAVGRNLFLAGWRLLSDSGTALGPVVITVAATVASLGLSSLALALLGLVGAGWLARWVPHETPELQLKDAPSA